MATDWDWGAPRRTNWLLFSNTHASDRTRADFRRPTRLTATVALGEQRRARSALTAVRHPDERRQFRKLLMDPTSPVPMITRERHSSCWGPIGGALRLFDETPVDSTRPALVNESYDCPGLGGAFPEFSALGLQPLESRLCNRMVLEVRTDDTASKLITQVGVARVGAKRSWPRVRDITRLDESTELLDYVVWTSDGDVLSGVGPVSLLGPGSAGARVLPRDPTRCRGGPVWLQDGALVARLCIEVDLRRARLALSVGGWAAEPVVLHIPGLIRDDVDVRPWVPFVSLTAVGQEARIIDQHIRADA